MDVLAAFTEACGALHNPATRAQAEQALLEFRSNAGVDACQYILQHSADEGVRFQAMLALRDMLLVRWTVVGQQAQAALHFLLLLVMDQLAADPRPLLRTQAIATAAALIKRGWEESSQQDREAVLQQIHALAAQQGSLEARRASLELLTAVVLEFSPATASAMGLSWETHERCRASLEATYLHGLLLHALASAREAAPAAASGADGGLCLAALGLLSAILSWNFSKAGGSGIWRTIETGRPVADSPHLRPPASWRDALLAPDAWDWLGQLAQAACQPQSASSPLAVAVRDVVVQLCGLSGDVFGPAETAAARAALGLEPQASLRSQHLQRLLRLLLPWVNPPQAAVAQARQAGEQQLLDACRALLSAAGVHRAAGFEAVSASLGLGPGPAQQPGQPGTNHEAAAGVKGEGCGTLGLLGLLAELTSAVVVAAGPGDAANQQGWEADAADMLLDTWVELLADPSQGGLTAGASEAAARAAAAVFGCIAESALQQAAAEALEDEEETFGGEQLQAEEWLCRVASLGRAAPGITLPLLAGKLQGCLAALQQSLQSGDDPSVALEQLCWLTTLCSHVLADAGEGETPLVPLPIAQACEEAARAGAADPAACLSQGLLAVGSHCLAHAGRLGASPRLMEVAAAALARWADTYLMTSDAASPVLDASFGSQAAKAAEAAQLLVSLALAALTHYPGEKALHEVACSRLLAVLVRRREVCAALHAAPAFRSLCEAVGRGDHGLLQLAEKVQRRLLQALVQAAAGWADAAGGARQLLESTAQQLRQLGASKQAAQAALARADGLHLSQSLLERLRGAVRGTLPPTQAAVFQQFTAAAPALATLLTACGTQPVAASLILKLAGDVVEYHGAYLSPSDATALCSWALQLLQLYSAQNLGQVSISASKAMAAETLADKYQDLRALLRLLTRLTQTDWGQGAPQEQQQGWPAAGSGAEGAGLAGLPGGVDVAQVVFAGLDIVVPLLDLELLKFPKLCRAYFALLAHMLEVYPERMAVLPGRVFQTLLSTLQFGVGVTGDEEVTQAVFEALAALARFHVQSTAAGGPGLGDNNAPGTDGTTPLGSLLHASLQRLVHGDSGLEAVDHAAEAVLPLALADPAVLQRCGEALLAGCADGSAKASAQAAFSTLIGQVGAAASLDRQARKAFNSALHRFVIDMRGAVRVR